MSMLIPRGGRPLVMAKPTPAARNSLTAAVAAAVNTLSRVSSAPSTSARKSRMLR
jgi:hypothetical protein